MYDPYKYTRQDLMRYYEGSIIHYGDTLVQIIDIRPEEEGDSTVATYSENRLKSSVVGMSCLDFSPLTFGYFSYGSINIGYSFPLRPNSDDRYKRLPTLQGIGVSIFTDENGPSPLPLSSKRSLLPWIDSFRQVGISMEQFKEDESLPGYVLSQDFAYFRKERNDIGLYYRRSRIGNLSKDGPRLLKRYQQHTEFFTQLLSEVV